MYINMHSLRHAIIILTTHDIVKYFQKILSNKFILLNSSQCEVDNFNKGGILSPNINDCDSA